MAGYVESQPYFHFGIFLGRNDEVLDERLKTSRRLGSTYNTLSCTPLREAFHGGPV